MSNKYNKTIKIKDYWCVSLEDIKSIVDVFSSRMKSPMRQDLNAIFESGHGLETNDLSEFINGLSKRYNEKDILNKIEIYFSSFNKNKTEVDKILMLSFNFQYSGYSNINIIAYDDDNSYKDWVLGSLDEIERKINTLEIEDKYKKDYEKYSKDKLIFDPDGKIKKEIIKDAQVHLSIVGTVEKNKILIINKKLWYEKPIGQIVIGLFILIVGTVILKIVGTI